MKVVILGASGMLGSMVFDWFSRDSGLDLIGTARSGELVEKLDERFPQVDWRVLDASACDVPAISSVIGDASWIINCIGVIKPFIHDDNPAEIERAIHVNALFPQLLSHAAEQSSARVLQIATDCVYSGAKGHYLESDKHDALDVYGKTKSLGETYSDNMNHLRCSIIGPELKNRVSLLDWFLGQSARSSVSGYVNHQWNGVTTLHFARLCHGIITQDLRLTHLQHIVPTGLVSKAELLGYFAREYKREDMTINAVDAEVVIDRTLATENDALNRIVWAAAGYAEPPTVEKMVAELAAFDRSLMSL